MKVESHVILTEEELKTLNDAFSILSEYEYTGLRVDDPMESLREYAEDCCEALDVFICTYNATYNTKE